MSKKQFDVLSPDGFSISFSQTYSSPEEAYKATLDWAKRYETQGYYSSVDYGRILVIDLPDFCKLIQVDQEGIMV